MADDTVSPEGLNYLAPETLTEKTYDAKSVIWSVGCILYELCTQQQAFSADTRESLISRITSGPDPALEGQFSSEFVELLSDMLSRIPALRPTVHEILKRPIVLGCLSTKCISTTDHLQDQLDKLKRMADNLEDIRRGTTAGSLPRGVIKAVGGITSIAGVLLAPATLGASLAVAGVGASVGLAGGLTAGASNIIKATKESSDRKAFKRIIKEFEEKINALTLWLQEIDNSLQTISQRASRDSEDNDNPEQSDLMFRTSTGRSVREVHQLARVTRSGTSMTRISKAAQIAGTASAVFSGLFVAADVFFVNVDVQELNNVVQTEADKKTRSEYMKFVESIREAADELQQVLDEFKSIIAGIDLLQGHIQRKYDKRNSGVLTRRVILAGFLLLFIFFCLLKFFYQLL